MKTKQQCCEQVQSQGGFHYHQCSRNAVVLRNENKPYCRIHDPVFVEQKRKAREAKWDAENKADEERFALEAASVASYCKACGPKARELAEADLLGCALDFVRLVLRGLERGSIKSKPLIDVGDEKAKEYTFTTLEDEAHALLAMLPPSILVGLKGVEIV